MALFLNFYFESDFEYYCSFAGQLQMTVSQNVNQNVYRTVYIVLFEWFLLIKLV